MAHDRPPPLVALSGGATRGPRYGSQISTVVDVHRTFEESAVVKGSCRLPDGIVIRPDPGMPALMSVSYEEPVNYDHNGGLNRPKELGQVKVLPHADFPVIKQEVCDTLDVIKEKLNQSGSNGDASAFSWSSPQIFTPTPNATKYSQSLPPLVVPTSAKKACNVARKKTGGKFVAPPANQTELKKGQKGQKRKLDGGSILENTISRLKKSKVSEELSTSSSSPITNARKSSNAVVSTTSVDHYGFDDSSDTPKSNATNAVKVAESNKKGSPAKGVKRVKAVVTPEKAAPSPDVSAKQTSRKSTGDGPLENAGKKSSPKKHTPLRIAFKEPKKQSKSASKGKKKTSPTVVSKDGKGKGSSDVFTQLKQVASTKKDSRKSTDIIKLPALSTSIDMDSSASESPCVGAKKGAKKRGEKKSTPKVSASDKLILASDKLISASDKSEENRDNVGSEDDLATQRSGADGEIAAMEVQPQPSTSTSSENHIDDDEDDSVLIVPAPVDTQTIEPIVIEPVTDSFVEDQDKSNTTDQTVATPSAIPPEDAANDSQENAVSADVALSIYLDVRKKVGLEPKTVPETPIEDPVPLKGSDPKSRVCDYPPNKKARSKSPVKGKSPEKRRIVRRMTSPLRTPMSPEAGNDDGRELEPADMDLALDIATRIQDQFTEAEFEQFFNPGAINSIERKVAIESRKSFVPNVQEKGQLTPDPTSKVPPTSRDKNYKLLDIFIPLNDCEAFKKKSQTLLKVPPRRNQLFKCEVCKGVFIDYQAFTLHKWSHDKAKFSCSECNTFYTTKKNLQWHINVTHKKEGNFECKFCPKRFLHEHYKNEHERLHTGTSKYKCRICSKMFFGMTGYRGHMRRHLGFEPFKCKKCGQGFALLQELNCHVIRHSGNRKFKCRFCGKGFYGMYECKRHEFSHSGERPFRCKYCSKRYSNKWSCEAHEKYHTGELAFTCPVCNKRFATKHQLRNHAVYHSDIKPFKCQYCEKSFVNRQILTCHERTHTKEKPYKCSYCEKGFAQVSDRTAHQRIHTGEKPYACKFCDRRFRKIGALKTHVKTHTGERTVKCRFCSWVFPDGEQVKKHEKRHAKGLPMPCFFCKRYFTNLQEHDESHQEEKEPFRCCFCNSRFVTFHDRWLHENTHTNPQRYNCVICNEDFCRRNVRDNHEKQMHAEKRERVPCPQCDKTYTDQAGLKFHMSKIHNENRPMFTCAYCHKEFKNEYYKTLHEKIHLGLDEKLKCAHCDYVTNRKYLLRRHQENHLKGTYDNRKQRNPGHKKKRIRPVEECLAMEDGSETPQKGESSQPKEKKFSMTDESFPCKEEGCDRVYDSAYSLLAHMRRHTKEYACDKCPEKFRNCKEFKDHIKKAHGTVKCKFCNESVQAEDLQEHESRHDNEKVPFQCKFCTTGFASEELREEHQKTHTGPRPYLCIICNRDFHCRSVWTYHQRSHTGAKPYECLTCKRRFAMSSSLTEHVRRIHVGGRQLKCRVCQKICESQTEFKAHVKTHQHERRFKCDMCPMAFYKVDHLTAHRQRHLGIKPFKCDACEQTFSSRNGCNKHIAKFHSGTTVVYKCDVCSETFNSQHTFRIHRNTHDKNRVLHACKICGQEFSNRSTMLQHEANHPADGTFEVHTCKICDRKFGSMSSLNYHVIFHGKGAKDKADDSTNNEDTDIEDSEENDDIKDTDNTENAEDNGTEELASSNSPASVAEPEISNPETSEADASTSSAKRKRSKSNREKRIMCVICGLYFSTAKGLDRHMERVHPEVFPDKKPSEFTCAICDMSFSKKKLIMQHMRSHQLGGALDLLAVPLEGVIGVAAQSGAMGNDTNNNSPLAKDLSVISGVSEVSANDAVPVGPVRSKGPRSVTKVAGSKKRKRSGAHQGVTQGETDDQSTQEKDSSTPPLSKEPLVDHQCHVCGQTFLRPSLLSRHQSKHHMDGSPSEQHECFVCLRLFGTPRALRVHLSVKHKGVPAGSVASAVAAAPLQCHLCPQVFVEVAQLRKHMLSIHKALNADAIKASVASPSGKDTLRTGNDPDDPEIVEVVPRGAGTSSEDVQHPIGTA